MLKSVAANLNNSKQFGLYEIGRTYIRGKEFFPREEKFICGVVVNKTFYDALGTLQSFLSQFQSTKVRVENMTSPPPYAHPSKCAVIKCGNIEIAAVYELHPQVLKNFDIKAAVSAFEINFTRLAGMKSDFSYTPLPKFPGIEIDVSVLVNKKTPAREIFELIRHSDQQLIKNISLIDIFEDKSLGEDKKSFTFRALLQSPDRTLTDTEMKTVQEKMFKSLRSAGFAIRGL